MNWTQVSVISFRRAQWVISTARQYSNTSRGSSGEFPFHQPGFGSNLSKIRVSGSTVARLMLPARPGWMRCATS